MIMNKAEKIGYNFLLELGYKPKQIVFDAHSSPDFMTFDNKGWEVKDVGRGKTSHFTMNQLSFMSLDVNIIVIKNNGVLQVAPLWFVLQSNGIIRKNIPLDLPVRLSELETMRTELNKVQLIVPNKESSR